jgi:hypothetical protein
MVVDPTVTTTLLLGRAWGKRFDERFAKPRA